MARPNRNNQEISTERISIEDPVYRVAIYARLSIEDNGCGSDSIENQIYMIEKFISATPGLSLVSTHFDNGKTGTNFDRPGFIAMLNEAKIGKINCIVVKDLSRFGRNYMETGNYLEKIFPFIGVRFISINDHYDSFDASSNEALALSLKNVYHHIYAKDISRKICTLFDVKKKTGLFLGRFAPYGYKKSDNNRYQLVIDEITAPIVRDIFNWRMDGIGTAAIAKKLNDLGVKSQYRRLYDEGVIKGTNGEQWAVWSGSSVIGILENPNYYGCMVERKSDGAYYKGGKTRILPKSEWTYIENTHEAIVDKSIFEVVQNLITQSKQKTLIMRNRHSERKRTENILRGLIVCGNCKRKMVRDGGYYDTLGNLIRHRYVCPKKYQSFGSCTATSVMEADLVNSVFAIIKVQISLLADVQDIFTDYLTSLKYHKQKKRLEDENILLSAKLMQLEIKILQLYGDYKLGLLSENGYAFAQKKYESEQADCKRKLDELIQKQSYVQHINDLDVTWINDVLSFCDESCLTREMCIKLVESIEVSGSHITVKYTFAAEYENLVSCVARYIKEGINI